ncbi:MAG: para-aminobenzoate synthetase component 1 [Pseudohongiellaceae bacterium]|jgi:para-aminobenzoate synthetase component 1
MVQVSLNIITEISINESLNDRWTQFPVTLTYKQTKALLKSLNQSVLFDSGADPTRGNFDILTGDPLAISRVEKHTTSNNTEEYLPIYSRPFNRNRLSIPNKYRNLPFICGMVGFCSYEFGAQKMIGKPKTLTNSALPSAFFAHYTWSYVYNRAHKQGFLTFSPECSIETRQKVVDLINNSALTQDKNKASASNPGIWNKTQDFEDYSISFNNTLDYIKDGDCYQVNLAQRFERDFEADSCELYFNLRENLNTPYSAYFSFLKDQSILCFSPEQFIGIKDKKVKTSPIKGTAENNENDAIYANSAKNLQKSLKNQAENLMIVDLMRNDLSKVCQLNSVKVNTLFKLQSFQNVHHLISEIEGILKPDINEIDAFISCFPGGSITGAPKKRAMEIIDELENAGRDAYCGSIFYWNDDGQFDSNILIRTIVQSEKKLYCWGGGGIVHDSTLEEEYQESLIKVANLTGIKS